MEGTGQPIGSAARVRDGIWTLLATGDLAPLSVRHYCTNDPALGTRSVEFTEENVLPSRKTQLAVHNWNGLRRADKARFQVRVTIAVLLVMQPRTARNQFLKQMNDIGLHAFVPVLLNHNRRGCSLRIDVHKAIANPAFPNHVLHQRSNVDQDLPRMRADGDALAHEGNTNADLAPHRHSIHASTCFVMGETRAIYAAVCWNGFLVACSFPILLYLDAAMRQKTFPRHSLIARLALAGAALLPAVAFALEFAPPGTPGTLTFKVKAEGSTRHKAGRGAGYEAIAWKIKNGGEFSIVVNAVEPTADTSPQNREKIGKADDAYRKTITENDQAIIDKWEEKVDACGGNEACENRVRSQMFADPKYQRALQKLQGAAPEIMGAAREVNYEPRMQIWTNTMGTSISGSGKVQFDVEETTFKVIDTAGGPPVDVTCRWAGTENIKLEAGKQAMGVFMTIDAKASTYELRIPADQLAAQLTESCRDSKDGAHGPSKNRRLLRVIGNGPGRGAKNFGQLLTFKGPVGSSRSPQFSGKQEVTTEWLSNVQPPQVPLKVTLEWHFSAKGR